MLVCVTAVHDCSFHYCVGVTVPIDGAFSAGAVSVYVSAFHFAIVVAFGVKSLFSHPRCCHRGFCCYCGGADSHVVIFAVTIALFAMAV